MMRAMLRVYRVTQFDKSLVEIAARFHVSDARVILENNTDVFPTGGEDVNTIPASLVNQDIQIPLPDDYSNMWEWGQYVARGGESLAAVCAKMNKDPRIDPRGLGAAIGTPPWLTPDYLLNLIENAPVRGGHGADASSVSLAPGEIVNVPFPPVSSRKRVIATSPGLPTTFQLEPTWLMDFINQYLAFSAQVRKYETQVAALRETQREGLGEVQRLAGMQRVLEVLKAHPAKPRQLLATEFGQLPPVESALKDARALAMDKLYANILKNERGPAYDGALALGRSILTTLRSDGLYRLAQKLHDDANLYPRRVNEFCAALAYAYQVLGDSPLADEMMPDVEACVRYVAGKKAVSGDAFSQVDPALANAIPAIATTDPPATALGVMTTLIRNLGGGVTAAVGNLPGPSTLSVALYRLWGLHVTSNAVAAATTTTSVSVTTTETAVLVRFTRNAFAEDDAAGEQILIAIAEVRQTQTFTITVAPNASYRAQLLERYDNAMSSPAWTKGLAITGVLIMVFSISDMVQKGQVNATDAIAATGGMAVTALSAVKLFATLSPDLVKGLTRGAAGLGFVLSLAQLIADSKAGADTTADWMSTSGSALLGISILELAVIPAPWSVGLAAVGGALVIGSIVYSLVTDDGVSNLFRTTAKRWFLGQARTFMAGPHYTAQQGSLAGKAKALEQAILDADFFSVDAGQRSALSAILSSPEEVGMLLGA